MEVPDKYDGMFIVAYRRDKPFRHRSAATFPHRCVVPIRARNVHRENANVRTPRTQISYEERKTPERFAPASVALIPDSQFAKSFLNVGRFYASYKFVDCGLVVA
ncbi:hypothetical protein TMPK1_16200 [Rhodospirillales bacterium TMPK1]|uniref:Uncharacterized protein n=1 Tax=Roseiterribacter gracilis TaxID=2812848 RepID=A0A8S8X7R9_9PROT|nr:hypothetical protein TMPK1_16200 [Rhodospirillales bacterium TMPK1]